MKKILYILLLSVPVLSFGQSNFYEELNSVRARHLLPKLRIDSVLEKESNRWTKKIIKNKGLLFHDYSSNRYEVLARSENPLNSWLQSKKHRKILLTRKAKRIGFYTENGYACARLQ